MQDGALWYPFGRKHVEEVIPHVHRVDHQGQPELADMAICAAKAARSASPRRVLVEVVEPALTDRNHRPVVARHLLVQRCSDAIESKFRFVGMQPDRCPARSSLAPSVRPPLIWRAKVAA